MRIRELKQPYISLPRHLKDQGYHTVSNGKVFHHMDDDPDAWSEKPWRASPGPSSDGDDPDAGAFMWMNPESREHMNPATGRGPYFECADFPEEDFVDAMNAAKTIADLKRLKAEGRPFFLATGFWRPHLPFNAPKKYFDLYDRDRIALAPNRDRPRDAPRQVGSTGELKQYTLAAGREADDDFHREARHAYYACVSFVDAQVGRLLDALEDLGLAEDTIVVLWGDHGWRLGEHNFWGKHSTLDTAVRAPLLIRAPGHRAGNRVDAVVEFVDIYPTLCDLAGLSLPSHLDGTSLRPLLDDPGAAWKNEAFMVWNGCRAVKTPTHLYTEWSDKQGSVTGRMLFDHRVDPREDVNVAGLPSNTALMEELSGRIRGAYVE